MSELKILHVGDQHLDVTPPRSRKDNYYESMKSKFMEVKAIAHSRNVDVVTWSGDMINRKEGHRVPYWLTNWLLDYFGDFNQGVQDKVLNLVAMGNHDIHGQAEMWPRQPIGTIVKTGHITPLWGDATPDNPLGYRRVIVPGKDPDLLVCFHGRMHDYDADKPERRALNYSVSRIKGREGFDVALTHTHFIPNGQRFISDCTTPGDVDLAVGLEARPDLYLCGHVHDDLGVFGGESYRCLNYGALSRGSIDEYNLSRTVKVGLVTITLVEKGKYKADIEPIELKAALPASDIFFLEELKEKRKKAAAIANSDFKLTAENIRATFSIVSPDEAVTLALKAVGAPQRVADRVRGYIDKARQVTS